MLAAAGIDRARIVVDPGVGVCKRSVHEIMGRLAMFHALCCGVLLGISRESFIGESHSAQPKERVPWSIAGILPTTDIARMALLALPLAAALLTAGLAIAADLSVEEVRALLEKATPEGPADFSGKNLSELDLSGLDFKRANLARADLFGTKLVGANLSHANLSGARLDLAWIMRADFTGANLTQASMFGPVVATSLAGPEPRDAPRFASADFSGARVIARLAGTDLRGARFVGARLGVDLKNQPMGQMRNDFSGADLSGADFSNADLNRAILAFAKLKDANLSGANLFRADLSRADLSGAELARADLTEADLDGTIFSGAKDLDAAKGFDRAVNADKAVR